jgi:hypothetical protein
MLAAQIYPPRSCDRATAAPRDFKWVHVRFGSMLLKKSLMISVSASI